jgi:hypothetical protein
LDEAKNSKKTIEFDGDVKQAMDSADKARADLQRMKTQKASIEKDMEEKSKSHLKLQESFSLLKKLSET